MEEYWLVSETVVAPSMVCPLLVTTVQTFAELSVFFT